MRVVECEVLKAHRRYSEAEIKLLSILLRSTSLHLERDSLWRMSH